MNTDEIRAWIHNNEPPFTLQTRGGKSYRIPDPTHRWQPPGYEDLICLAVPGKGLIVLRLDAIDSVQIDHEPAVSR